MKASMIFIYASSGEQLYWDYTTQIRQTLLVYDILTVATAERIIHDLAINNGYTCRLRLRNASYLLSKPLLDRDSHLGFLTFNFKKEQPYHEPRKDFAA